MPRRAFVLAQAVAAGAVLSRLARGRRRRPPLDAAAAPPPDAPVSVVIPARDEALRLGPCLDGLRDDADVGEIVVVDDCSTDGTGTLAQERGARVVTGAPLPEGWAGKAWALEQGLRAARGEWVVFLDADTRPRPGLVRALVAAARETGCDLLSAAPRFACDGMAERALHASMLASLVLRTGPTDVEGWQPRPERAIANGQCLVARRATIVEAGGWGLVGSHMTEDVAMARALRRDGRRLAFVDAADLLEVRMYEGLGETWTGWGRSLMGTDVTSRAWSAADLATLWLVQAAPLVRVLTRRATPLDAALLAIRLALVAGLARAYRPRGAGLWLSPLADVATCLRLTQSVLRPTRTWRGRSYG